MPNLINELSILSTDGNIFSNISIKYIVPLYQRAFAWEEKEIVQLIEDINDFTENSYYIGSLIVSKIGDNYEVIDGQQRLTALFLLLSSLKVSESLDIRKIENTLLFACREKSNSTLKNINNLLPNEEVEITLQTGKHIIDTIINGKNFCKKHFLSQLKKVKIYRIEVPKNTDLNRYFEIMNTRGEQLEQHDILKANLMREIKNNGKREMFAKIWDACSDMTGYVQMHFDSQMRSKLFGQNWDKLPQVSFECTNTNEKTIEYKIEDIIKTSFEIDNIDGVINKDKKIRFESIISFPFFLLHTLKVYIIDRKIIPSDIFSSLLDDKKLIDIFDKVIKNGKISEKNISENREEFSIDFIEYLLKCRFLFDKYIIKREYINENSDGEWSLKELKISKQAMNSVKTTYYSNSCDLNIIMLQSCLRVSYTSPKVMHWITTLLNWLYDENNFSKLNSFEIEIENIAKKAITENFLKNSNYSLGTNTPHIVFNYLDYLLWKSRRNEFSDFVFEFRNSVEHWYPQNPSEGTFEKWINPNELHGLGNLCIIQRSANSKFSNMIPEAKAKTFKNMIEKGSLKLRLMAKITNSSEKWKTTTFKKHQDEMLEVLINACAQ